MDLRDIWEGFVPFGRLTGWVARRIFGVGLAALGRVIRSEPLQATKIGVRDNNPSHANLPGSGHGKDNMPSAASHLRRRTQDMESFSPPLVQAPTGEVTSTSEFPLSHALGLHQAESLNSAPDVDAAEVTSIATT